MTFAGYGSVRSGCLRVFAGGTQGVAVERAQSFIAPGIVSRFCDYVFITVQSSANLHVMCSLTPGLPVRQIPPASPRQLPQASYLFALMCVSWRAARAAERKRSGRKPCLTWPSHVEGESK